MTKRILVIGTATFHMRRWFHYVIPILPDDIVVDMLVTSKDATADMFEGADNVFYKRETPKMLRPLLKIPKIRGLVLIHDLKKTMEAIVEEREYYAVNIHQLFGDTINYVKVAKSHGMKVVLTPWGSDVLRCPKYQVPIIKKMFRLADYVTSNLPLFSEKYINLYNVHPNKMLYAGFASEIFDLIPEIKGKYSKSEMADKIGIPVADYYIACGYMADQAQRHKLMIESLGMNSDLIPKNAMLLFPFTYGNGRNEIYMSELKELCDKYNLKCHFVTDYLTNEQMAMLRIIADLFIHIQPTDAASASLVEYLQAGVQVINGKWLDYPNLEKDCIPYHVCEDLESLPELLKNFFEGKLKYRFLSDTIQMGLKKRGWSSQKYYWKDIFCQI